MLQYFSGLFALILLIFTNQFEENKVITVAAAVINSIEVSYGVEFRYKANRYLGKEELSMGIYH